MSAIYDTGFGDSELAQKAKVLYEQRIAPTLTDADFSKYLVIDTETGDYELDRDSYHASHRTYLKRPGVRTRFGVRVGFAAAVSTCGVQTPRGQSSE